MASYEGQSTQSPGQVEYRDPELEQSSTPRTYPKSTYVESSDTPIEGTSTSPNYTPYRPSSTAYDNPTAVPELPNQFAYTRNTSDAFFDDEPSEEHDKFDLPTPTYPSSSPAPAAAFRYPSSSNFYPGVAGKQMLTRITQIILLVV